MYNNDIKEIMSKNLEINREEVEFFIHSIQALFMLVAMDSFIEVPMQVIVSCK